MSNEQFAVMSTVDLHGWILDRRSDLAIIDRAYTSIRETGDVPSEDMVNQSMEMRVELDLAERELAKRGDNNREYGVTKVAGRVR